jgi:predicted RNA-binding protein with PIN domain
VLGFTKKLPTRALRTVQAALEADESFRARVAEDAQEGELGRAGWLYLTRPSGWADELDGLVAAAADEQRDTEALRSELSAQRRVEQLADNVERLRADLAEAERARAQADAELGRERSGRLASEASRDELVGRVAELEDERARAVKQLKATETTATSRLEALRSAQAQVAELQARVRELEATPDAAGPAQDAAERAAADEAPAGNAAGAAPSPWNGTDPAAVADAVASAARAAAVLGEALAAAAAGLTPVAVPPSQPPPASEPARDVAVAAPRPSRRVPVRLRGGVHDGTPEGLQQLLEVEGMVAIVDGYNVTMEGWPALDHHGQRSSLVTRLGGVQTLVPAAIHVVFDGDADGRRPSVGAPLPVRVHFSPADTEADDVILSMVAGLPTDTPVLVVSSDRRVAEGARRLGANSVRSSVLLELLRR